MARRAIGFRVNGVAEFDAEALRARNFLMAAAAVGKIICAESPLFVVAGRAAICLTRVHRHRNRRHFIASQRVVAAIAV